MPSPATISGAKPEFGDVPVIDESTTAPTLLGEGVTWTDITIDSTLLDLDSGLLEYNALDWSWGHPTDSLAIERRRPDPPQTFSNASNHASTSIILDDANVTCSNAEKRQHTWPDYGEYRCSGEDEFKLVLECKP
jgi:hypothetical protein